ncbi:MAG: homocysteine S-methyltransferase family protein [Legionellaceae bacterium]|nr:homocysteine S-methyltransferase family protein [Legionellaceae bacterium]
MKLSLALKNYELIVANGPLGTRLKYDFGYHASYDLTQDSKGKGILVELFKADIAVASQKDVPIIINAATFRASRNHLASNGINDFEKIKEVNFNNLQLTIDLRNELRDESTIILGAPLGSMFDAYSIDTKPTVVEAYNYHQEQISFFKQKKIDFISVVTVPSLSEALGIAIACDESGLEYTIGFILASDGKLLDGTSIDTAIIEIDQKTKNKPVGYNITCTHSSVLKLLDSKLGNLCRLIGFQANGSCLPPSELAKLDKPIADDPEIFSFELKEIKERFNLKMIAGCCGTNKEHLSHIINACKNENRFCIYL